MKAIIEITCCKNCPFHCYMDQYDNWRSEDVSGKSIEEGLYCKKSKRIITNENIISDWCTLNFI